MPQTLSAVPNLKLPGKQAQTLTRRHASQLRGFKFGDFAKMSQPSQILQTSPTSEDERISLFPDVNLRIPVGKMLAALIVIVLGLLLLGHFSQVGAFLSGFIYDPRNASISGDPVITGMVDWLPILLVGLSTLVLAGLIINRAQYGRSLQRTGPRLVTRSQNAATRPLAAPVPIRADRAFQDHAHLFLVPQVPQAPRTAEIRHEAQEQVRLDRDARAAALARADAADRLVVSSAVHMHQSEALVVPRPRRVLHSMPLQAAPLRPLSGVFFPATETPATKPLPANAPRLHLSRAPHAPPAIL